MEKFSEQFLLDFTPRAGVESIGICTAERPEAVFLRSHGKGDLRGVECRPVPASISHEAETEETLFGGIDVGSVIIALVRFPTIESYTANAAHH